MSRLSEIGLVKMAFMPGMSMREAQANLAENSAAVALATVARPQRLDAYLAEVDRRAELFADSWYTSPDTSPSETPKAAALRSVYDDVVAGRLL